jgi:hypothetical protein
MEMHVDTPRIQAALEEIKALILERHSDAIFHVTYGEDPCGIYLKAIVDIDDTDEVTDLYTDRLVDLQVEEELPIYIIPLADTRANRRSVSNQEKLVCIGQTLRRY